MGGIAIGPMVIYSGSESDSVEVAAVNSLGSELIAPRMIPSISAKDRLIEAALEATDDAFKENDYGSKRSRRIFSEVTR